MLFPTELRDLVCLLLAKIKKAKRKEKCCHADFSAPSLDLFTQSSKNNQTNIHNREEARLPSHAKVRLSVWGTQTFASPCPRAIRACRDGHRAFCFRLLQQLAAKWQANEDNPLQEPWSAARMLTTAPNTKTLTGRRGGSSGSFYCFFFFYIYKK